MKEKLWHNSWLQTLIIVLVLIVLFPYWLKMGKDKIYDKDGIRFYASATINPDDVAKVAERALQLLSEHNVMPQGTTSIILYDSRDEFRWRNLFISSDALAMNWWPFPCVTFAPVDMTADRQYARTEKLTQRPVSSVIAHELTHTYQAEQLTVIGYKYHTWCHKWKTEGMAETVAESSSVPLEQGLQLFLNDASQDEIEALNIAAEYFYFRSHLKADYLLNHKKTSFADYWSTDYDETALEEEIRNAINARDYQPQW